MTDGAGHTTVERGLAHRNRLELGAGGRRARRAAAVMRLRRLSRLLRRLQDFLEQLLREPPSLGRQLDVALVVGAPTHEIHALVRAYAAHLEHRSATFVLRDAREGVGGPVLQSVDVDPRNLDEAPCAAQSVDERLGRDRNVVSMPIFPVAD